MCIVEGDREHSSRTYDLMIQFRSSATPASDLSPVGSCVDPRRSPEHVLAPVRCANHSDVDLRTMPPMALRTGLTHLLGAHTPRFHSLPSAYSVPRRSAGALSHSALRSPPQALSHLMQLRAPPLQRLAATSKGATQALATGAEPSSLGSPLWQQFAAAASGEWEGVTVTFSPGEDGVAEAQELPSRYVPSAFACAPTRGGSRGDCSVR